MLLWAQKTFHVPWKHCSSEYKTVLNLSSVPGSSWCCATSWYTQCKYAAVCSEPRHMKLCVQQAVLPETHWTHYLFGLIFSHCAIHKHIPAAKFLRAPRLSSCDPSRWGHDLQFEKLGFRWIQAPGWDLVCLIFISDCLCQYCSEAPTIDTDLCSMDELTTYTSLLLWTCLSPLLFCLTMWFDTVFPSLNLTL